MAPNHLQTFGDHSSRRSDRCLRLEPASDRTASSRRRTTPNGNSTASGYDDAGRLVTKLTTGSGGTPTRASYTYSYNRASVRLSEASTISGDPGNGTATFGYDGVGRLISYGSPLGSASNETYGWQEVANRSSVLVGGGTQSTLTFNAADRITSTGYGYDLDGRMTIRPG